MEAGKKKVLWKHTGRNHKVPKEIRVGSEATPELADKQTRAEVGAGRGRVSWAKARHKLRALHGLQFVLYCREIREAGVGPIMGGGGGLKGNTLKW